MRIQYRDRPTRQQLTHVGIKAGAIEERDVTRHKPALSQQARIRQRFDRENSTRQRPRVVEPSGHGCPTCADRRSNRRRMTRARLEAQRGADEAEIDQRPARVPAHTRFCPLLLLRTSTRVVDANKYARAGCEIECVSSSTKVEPYRVSAEPYRISVEPYRGSVEAD